MQNLPNPLKQGESSLHVWMTVDWGDDEEQGKGAGRKGEVEEWEGQQSVGDREEEDHFMAC